MILALLSSCGARGPSPRSGRPDAPGSAVHFSRPPVIDGSRRACLEPPYTPAHDLTSLEDGTIDTMRGDGRTWQLKTPGARDATFEEVQALMQRLRARGEAFQFVSHGVYCDDHMCLAWSGNLCEVNVLERYAQLRAAIAEDGVLADARIEVAISLAGNLGPRCEASDRPPALLRLRRGQLRVVHAVTRGSRPRRARALHEKIRANERRTRLRPPFGSLASSRSCGR